MIYDLDEYDIDELRRIVEEHYYRKFEESKDSEDEIKYIEVRWKSDSEIISIAASLGVNLNEYKISKRR